MVLPERERALRVAAGEIDPLRKLLDRLAEPREALGRAERAQCIAHLGERALDAGERPVVEAGLCLGPLWLPLPPALAPRVWGREEAAGEGAGPRVRVRIEWPGARRLLEYEGRAVFEEVRG